MKKLRKFAISSLLLALAITASAQLKVNSSGKVMIGSTTQNPLSTLALGGVGNNYAKAYFEGDGYVLQLKPLGKSSNMSSSQFGNGLRIVAPPVQNSGLAGVYSNISGNYNSANGFAVGVEGIAGNGQNGYNYGVAGSITGTKNGAAIFGTIGNNAHSTAINGRYAGYFDGKVWIGGDLYCDQNHVYYFADADFMPNKQSIGSTLSKVMTLNPVEYKFSGSSDSLYALTAQNVSTVFPHLVKSDGNFIDYFELIPILVKTIKELQDEIEELQNQIAVPFYPYESPEITSNIKQQQSNKVNAVLYQNNPNPFSNSTKIRFKLTDNDRNAYICIFDMTGKMQKQIPVDASMQSITINGYELSAGMYIYSLVVNGKEMDTKRMILTK